MAVALQYLVSRFNIPLNYTTYYTNRNVGASEYLNNNYNLWGVPTCYLDGGVEVMVGIESWEALLGLVETAGSRVVPALGFMVTLNHLEGSLYDIEITIKANERPLHPEDIEGIDYGLIGETQVFSTVSTDPEGGSLWYMYDWGDSTNSGWLGPHVSGEPCALTHTWDSEDDYEIKVVCRDEWYHQSDPVYKTVSMWTYIHGDANGDLYVNILDVTYLIQFLYSEGPPPDPYPQGDADGNVVVNIVDISYLINYLYYGGSPPQ